MVSECGELSTAYPVGVRSVSKKGEHHLNGQESVFQEFLTIDHSTDDY